MGRMESAACPRAGGVLCAFAVAVVLKKAAWQAGVAAVVVPGTPDIRQGTNHE